MAHAIAYTRNLAPDVHEYARVAVVSFCALALIAAGQALPFA
ncbi:MAG: hypothetical protein P1U62_08090 [Alteraurantiacibacter sp. bin_em_oilr2.035]|nr:hypothetical protein [Aurantiacibacter atlanticus]MDF1834827.1 hypothetical protein [Alteraurantiacibacter sp. bin_em_oilr2.035]